MLQLRLQLSHEFLLVYHQGVREERDGMCHVGQVDGRVALSVDEIHSVLWVHTGDEWSD